MSSIRPQMYSGHENLLIMRRAKNYNAFLGEQIRRNGENSQVVLDFGAGVGAIADSVKVWAPELICLEPDKIQVSMLRSSGFRAVETFSEVAPGSVDYIYSVNVLEHIEDDRAAINNIYKTLKSNGRFFAYVPALQWLYSSMDTAVGHFRRYHMRDLIENVSSAGFVVNSAKYVDSLGVPATIAYKLVGSERGEISESSLVFYDRLMFPISRFLDILFQQHFGKNLLIVCQKP